MQIPIDLIEWNVKDNPRKYIDEDNLSSLKKSMFSVQQENETRRALLEPIGVTPRRDLKTASQLGKKLDLETDRVKDRAKSKEHFGIIVIRLPDGRARYASQKEDEPAFKICYGWRRYQAMKELSRTYEWADTIEVNITGNHDDQTFASFALMENVQRENMSTLEEAASLKEFVNQQGDDLSRKEVAEMIGKSKGWVSQRLQILQMDEEVRERVEAKDLSISNIRQLMRLDKPDLQHEVLDFIETRDPTHGEIKNAVEARKMEIDSSGATKSDDTKDSTNSEGPTSSDDSSEPDNDDMSRPDPPEDPTEADLEDGTNQVSPDQNISPRKLLEEIQIYEDAVEKRKSMYDEEKYNEQKTVYAGAKAALFKLMGELEVEFPFVGDDVREDFIDDPEEFTS